jgi:hypothetical protein
MIGWAVLAAIVALGFLTFRRPPPPMRRKRAEARLVETRGNVTVLRPLQDDDPFIGCCGRCGRWWSQHPGGYCPDGIDAGGLVAVDGPVFELSDEVAE